MDDILLTHLKSNDYNLLEDKDYQKIYLELATQRASLKYFDEVSKRIDK